MQYFEDRNVWEWVMGGQNTKEEEEQLVCWMCLDCYTRGQGSQPDNLSYSKKEWRICCFCSEWKQKCFALWLFPKSTATRHG